MNKPKRKPIVCNTVMGPIVTDHTSLKPKCRGFGRYQGIHRSRCCGGLGCQACWRLYWDLREEDVDAEVYGYIRKHSVSPIEAEHLWPHVLKPDPHSIRVSVQRMLLDGRLELNDQLKLVAIGKQKVQRPRNDAGKTGTR